MASAPAQGLPLFYKDLQPLSSLDHADWKARNIGSATFFAQAHAVPLTVEEFISAQRFHPIVFSAGANPVPLALMGLNEGVNVFVDETGQPQREMYIPAYVRRYPFLLARLRPDSDELSLCFDPTSGVLGAFDEGDAIFNDGEPTDVIKGTLEFCEKFEQAGAQSGFFMNELINNKLLIDGEATIQLPDGSAPFIYRGFQIVSEERVLELRGDVVRKLVQTGVMPLIYAHLFSLQLMQTLFGLQQEQGKVPQPELVLPS
ncbi:SapC family protein [Sphingomonas montanisoli]|uniref:SapC family protein n=1 Tax=Sphingomonas montanisoli TaxID=2606412 RepID=A0A5D9CD96_9SPHN|nr:SapC family protein [Sphingomonas montanisoli]TZG29307.1 SapC family protein [Sphingomonas montanisoli]